MLQVLHAMPNHTFGQSSRHAEAVSAACSGNKLWEWFSVGHYGLGGYDAKTQSFKGEAWPEVSRPLAPFCGRPPISMLTAPMI